MKHIHLSIFPPPPFRLDLTVWALRRRATNRIDFWDGDTYRRAMILDDFPALISVQQFGTVDLPQLEVTVLHPHPSRRIEFDVISTLRMLLGLEIDLSGFYDLAAKDRQLAPLTEPFRGVRPPRFPTLFEAIVNSIVCQQLSLDAAISTLNRIVEKYGRSITVEDSVFSAFPDPRTLASQPFEDLRKTGVTVNKAKAILEAAAIIAAGNLSLDDLEKRDNSSALSLLERMRGIGRWTADYVLLRGLGRLDVFPRNDSGALAGMKRWLTQNETTSDFDSIVLRWAPYAGLVYFHLLLRGLLQKGVIR